MDFTFFVERSSLFFAQPTTFFLSARFEVRKHWVFVNITLFLIPTIWLDEFLIYRSNYWHGGSFFSGICLSFTRVVSRQQWRTWDFVTCSLPAHSVNIFLPQNSLGWYHFFPPKTNWQRTPSAWFGSKMKASPPSWKGFPGGFFATTTKLPLERRIGSSMGMM